MSSTRIFTAEAIGTAILVGAMAGAASLSSAGGLAMALVGGLALLVAYASIAATSGGHFNPAISAGMAMAKRIDVPALFVYWAGQVVGAFLGALGVYAVARGRFGGFDADIGDFAANLSGHDVGMYSFAGVAVAEILATAFLVMVYLLVRSSDATAVVGALPIGAAFALTQILTVAVDGGGTNPAKSIATALFARGEALSSLWIFVVFPLLGSLLGVLAWVAIDEATLEDTFFDELGLDEARDAVTDAVEQVTD